MVRTVDQECLACDSGPRYGHFVCLRVRSIGHRRWTEDSSEARRPLRLHLGCGKGYINLPGYVNIDINPFNRKDIWLDVRFGLPFPDRSVDGI